MTFFISTFLSHTRNGIVFSFLSQMKPQFVIRETLLPQCVSGDLAWYNSSGGHSRDRNSILYGLQTVGRIQSHGGLHEHCQRLHNAVPLIWNTVSTISTNAGPTIPPEAPIGSSPMAIPGLTAFCILHAQESKVGKTFQSPTLVRQTFRRESVELRLLSQSTHASNRLSE